MLKLLKASNIVIVYLVVALSAFLFMQGTSTDYLVADGYISIALIYSAIVLIVCELRGFFSKA